MDDSSRRRSIIAVMHRFWFREFVGYVVVGLAATVAVTFALKLWRMTWSIPLSYRADSIISAANIDAVLKTGWYEHQPQLGAPFGQIFYDFPMADNLHLVIIGVLGKVVPQFGAVMNLYYLLGYPLAALTAMWFFRFIGLSRFLSGALAVLFAIAPYHFFRGENHYFLAGYWPIPLFGVLLVKVILGRPLWARGASDKRTLRGFLNGSNVGTLVILGIAGSATQYYAVFDLLILALAALLAMWRDRNLGRLIGYFFAWATIGFTLFVNMLPDFLFAWKNGPNYVAAFRPAIHAEWFALQVASLFIPSNTHRSAILAKFAQSYEEQFPVWTYTGLGLVAGAGFIVLMVALTRRATSIPIRSSSDSGQVRGRLQKNILLGFSAITLWILLFATSGGLVIFISLLVTTKVRGWDRLSIYLMLLGLAAIGIAVQQVFRAVVRRRDSSPIVRRFGLPAIAMFILLLGAWDQTNVGVIPDYATVKTNFQEDDSYAKGLESSLPVKSMIYQLPYQPFPEGPYLVNNMVDYDHLRLSLHTTSLRFSYGGVKGRPQTDWASQLVGMPTKDMLERVSAAHFAGISVNRHGYADSAKAFESDLATILGETPIVSDHGTYSFWSLKSFTASLIRDRGAAAVSELGYETTHPAMVYGVWPGLTPVPVPGSAPITGTSQTWQATVSNTTLDIATNSNTTTSVHISFFVGFVENLQRMDLLLPDGTRQNIPVNPSGMPIELDLRVKPGSNYIHIEATANHGARAYLIQNLNLEKK